jgi:hypothetical protein
MAVAVVEEVLVVVVLEEATSEAEEAFVVVGLAAEFPISQAVGFPPRVRAELLELERAEAE